MNLKWFLNRRIKDKYIGVCIANFIAGGLSDNNIDEVFWHDNNGIVLKRVFFLIGKKWRKEYLKRYIKQSKIGVEIMKLSDGVEII